MGQVRFIFRFDRSTPVRKGIRLPSSADRPGCPDGNVACVDELECDSQQEGCRSRALIVGVGPGFGYSLARLLAAEGFDLILVCRDASRLTSLVQDVHNLGANVEAYGADATVESDVRRLFSYSMRVFGVPDLVVYSLEHFPSGKVTDTAPDAFESAWRSNCFGAFLIAQAAANQMSSLNAGSIFLIGSTSSIIGRPGYLNLSVGKFGQRALAQVMARELWPLGIHVAHVIIDAGIAEKVPLKNAQANPDDIARSILGIHRQPRTAWSSELDLRAWNERFWEHC